MKRKSLKKFLVLLLTTSMVGTMYVPAMATEVRPSDTTVESTDEQNVTDNQGTAENAQENQVSVQSDEATGTEENTGAGVAQIGEKTYSTLQEAVNEAEAEATIQLLTDVTEDVTITEGKNLTLDLNGRTLKNTGAGKATVLVDANAQVVVKNGTVLGGASYYNIKIEKTGTVVFEDIVATAGNNKSSMIDNWGALTIESGTYTGGLNVVKNEPTGDITINNGTFEMTNVGSLSGFTGIVITFGKLVINDGTFKQSVTNVRGGNLQTIFVDVDPAEPSNPLTYINGGNFTNATKIASAWNVRVSNAATSAAKISVSGGTFNKNLYESYLADGYECVKSGSTYSIKKAPVAESGSTKYTDLETALAEGGNVKLLRDITTDATKTEAADRLYIKKDCTLDLNGHAITFPYELEPTDNFAGFFVNGATMTVKDTSEEQTGKIQTGDQDNMGVYLFNVIGGGTLILESGNYFGGGTVAQAQKGNVYVKGGNYAVKAFQAPYDSQFLLNCYDPAYKNGSATITVTGGTFENFDPANCTAESTGTSFVAAGYESTGNNGTYTVAKKFDAEEALTADTKVTGTASNATIGGNYTGKEKDIETKDGNVTINISNGDKNVIASNIFVSNESIKSLNDNSSVENVAIKSDVADMTINKDALTAINTAAAGEDVMFKIEKESTDEQLLYHVTAVAGGKDVYTASTSATNGNVSISVPYALNTEGMTPIVYYVPASGAKQVVESTYVDGTLTWKTSHFSTFEIGEALENSVAQITAKDGTVTKYATLQSAIDAAKTNATVQLTTNTKENVEITKQITLDLNGYTLNGGTEANKAALTITNQTVTVKDSSENQTGTIKREDTAENSEDTSYYVIDVQGRHGLLKFESGNVENNSKTTALVRLGDDSISGAYPTLTIYTGIFTQNNSTAIKVERGTLYVKDGTTINCENGEAVSNGNNAYIQGGTINGAVTSWVDVDGNKLSKVTISGGTINGNVFAMSDGTTDKTASVIITGGTITGKLATYLGEDETEDASIASIKVTGGTFDKDPSKYTSEEAVVSDTEDGKYTVAKTVLAMVGDKAYYTMEDAFAAQTESKEPIVLQRNYTTTTAFSSGSIDRVLNLNGFTYTYAPKTVDPDTAAFEINYSDVTLTVENGTVISASMIGLIPSAMKGTITYNNSALVFEQVNMTTTGASGFETNGSNTSDAITLKDCTLDVPNGYGIYFPSSGTLTIENTKITAKTMGVQVCAGDLSITGDSKITVTGDSVSKTENDGAIEDGAAISIIDRTGYKGLGKVKIEDGTFTSKEGYDAVKAYKWENNTASTFEKEDVIAISGGTFSSEIPAEYCQSSDGTSEGYLPVEIKDSDDNVVYSVDNSVQANFWGGQLKMDYYKNADGTTDYTKTDLRFGYEYQINPDMDQDAVKITAWGWKYSVGDDSLDYTLEGKNSRANNGLGKNYATVTNLLITEVPTSAYQTDIYSQMYVTYEKDGKIYTAKTSIDHRSVSEIVNKILDDDAADDIQKKYAQGLKDSLE